MHFQSHPHAEVKLVRCTRGAVYDVIIDLRRQSPTFMGWLGVELTEENRRMLYATEGFARGYQTLLDRTETFYQISQPPVARRIISPRDQACPDSPPR